MRLYYHCVRLCVLRSADVSIVNHGMHTRDDQASCLTTAKVILASISSGYRITMKVMVLRIKTKKIGSTLPQLVVR